MKVTKAIVLLLIINFNFACTSVTTLSVKNFQERTPVKVIDKSKEGAIDVSLIEYSNIYSCHYGTMKIKNEKISPNVSEYMRKYLSHNLKSKAVVLINRLDIYTNSNAKLKSGLSGQTFYMGPRVHIKFGNLSPKGNQIIGCKGAHAGEYAMEEVNSKWDVPILVYFKGAYNGKRFSIRTISGKNEAGVYPTSDDLKFALDKTFGALVKKYSTRRFRH